MKTIVIGTIIKTEERRGGRKPDEYYDFGCVKELIAENETELLRQFEAFTGEKSKWNERLGEYQSSRIEGASGNPASFEELLAYGTADGTVFYADYYMTVTKRFEG